MRQFKGGNAYNNGGAGAQGAQNNQPPVMVPPVKLARTGIEQVFCSDRPRFIDNHREFERVATVNVSVNNEHLFAVAPVFLYLPSSAPVLGFAILSFRYLTILALSLPRPPPLPPTAKVFKWPLLSLAAT